VTDCCVIKKISYIVSVAVITISDCDHLLASFMIELFLNLTSSGKTSMGLHDNEERTDTGVQTIIVVCSQMFVRTNNRGFLISVAS
jgi:phage gp36-like protein